MRRDGVTFAVHGLDHRTRHANPRRHSEFTGLPAAAVEERLDAAQSILRVAGLPARVFVPPFNRFDAASWTTLARRFDVVCGGPENVRQFGCHVTPSWRGDAVWLPGYPPVYGSAEEVLPALRALVAQRAALWVPVVLHWGWEREQGWEALRELVTFIAEHGLSRPWEEFFDQMQVSRDFAARAYESEVHRSDQESGRVSAVRAA